MLPHRLNRCRVRSRLKLSEPYNAQVKGKGRPYSTTERRVAELISVRGSQPAGDVSHKPGGRQPLLSPQACSYPPEPLRGLLPTLLLGEQRHNWCEQFA